MIRKARRGERDRWKAIREQVWADMDEEIEKHLRKIKRDLLGQNLGDLKGCVMKFLNTSPADALTAVFHCCLEMFNSRHGNNIMKFLTTITKDEFGRQLFQLALYMSCKRLLGDALENEVDKRVKTELEVANNQASHTETGKGPEAPSEGLTSFCFGLIWKKHSCGIPNAADTRFSALEFGECQSRCRNRQHKLH